MGSAQELRGDPAAKVNFPLYAVEMLTDRHFVVAGGGGAAKTGVSNGFVCSENDEKLTGMWINYNVSMYLGNLSVNL